MVNDTISDILTRLRNASLTGAQVAPIPLTQLSQKICKILKEEGLINAYERTSNRELVVALKYKGPEKKPSITNLRRISRPGLRIYANHRDIPKVLGGLGIVIISTSRGIMTDREGTPFAQYGKFLFSARQPSYYSFHFLSLCRPSLFSLFHFAGKVMAK